MYRHKYFACVLCYDIVYLRIYLDFDFEFFRSSGSQRRTIDRVHCGRTRNRNRLYSTRRAQSRRKLDDFYYFSINVFSLDRQPEMTRNARPLKFVAKIIDFINTQ